MSVSMSSFFRSAFARVTRAARTVTSNIAVRHTNVARHFAQGTGSCSQIGNREWKDVDLARQFPERKQPHHGNNVGHLRPLWKSNARRIPRLDTTGSRIAWSGGAHDYVKCIRHVAMRSASQSGALKSFTGGHSKRRRAHTSTRSPAQLIEEVQHPGALGRVEKISKIAFGTG